MSLSTTSYDLQDGIQCHEQLVRSILIPLQATNISLFRVKSSAKAELYYSVFVLKTERKNKKFIVKLDGQTLDSLRCHFPDWASSPEATLFNWVLHHSRSSLPQGVKNKLNGPHIC